MTRRNDQVFQLSLTELAFMIIFILLLLLGYLVFREQEERQAAEEELRSVQGVQQVAEVLEKAKRDFGDALRVGKASNPDDVISAMVEAANVQDERNRLQREVEDLNAKMTAMVELQKAVEAAGDGEKGEIVKSEVASALALQEEVRNAVARAEADKQPASPQSFAKVAAVPPFSKTKTPLTATASSSPAPPASSQPTPPKDKVEVASLSQAARQRLGKDAAARVREAFTTHEAFRKEAKEQLGINVQPGREVEAVQSVVSDAREYNAASKSGQGVGVIRKENSDLRGQVAYLKNRLEARGGRDWPPCWADESGTIQFLFTVDLSPDTITLSPAWPPSREADAQALPSVADLPARPLSHQEFQANVQGIFEWSKHHDPQCRHYVHLRNNSIPDSKTSDRVRLMVEGFFYKSEARR